MKKILIGGSPCTYWSVAQKNNRETEPSGIGWELFENYLIAKEKFKPDFFLYENNKSAAQAIKDEIKKRLNAWDGTLFMQDSGARYIEINSALVSAQNRQRFYVHNCGEVEQPKDRGILLKDILEIRVGTYPSGAKNKESKQYRIYGIDGKSTTLCGEGGGMGAKTGLYAIPKTIERALPKLCDKYGCIPEMFNAYNGVEITDKAPTLSTGSMDTSSCAVSILEKTNKPVYEVRDGKITIKGKQYPIKLADGFYIIRKLTVTECCRLQTMPDFYMSARIEKVKEIVLKCKDVPTQIVTIPLQTEKQGYAINTTFDLKEMEVQNLKDQSLTPHCLALSRDVIDIDKRIWDIVLCTIKDLREKGQHDYLEAIMNMFKATMSADLSIEKLPKECLDENLKREKSYTILTLIQKIIEKITSMFVPQKNTRVYIENCAENCLSASPTSLTVGTLYSMEKNMRLVSESACYKGLGNGWTAEVIIHILSNALKDVPKDEEIVVLSMYDGIGTGRYCLDKMGFTNVEYHAYEIDKYAMQIAMSNYPDIMQHGDAYQVREEDWKI